MLWLLINSIQLNTYSSHVHYVPGIVLGKGRKDKQKQSQIVMFTVW